MKCPSCAHDNRESAKFCDGCGAPVAPVCLSCAVTLRPGARFCDECGQSVTSVSADPIGAPADWRTGSPASYTPKHLADKILQSKSALEACPEPSRRGERKQVTVLFADIKGDGAGGASRSRGVAQDP